MFWIEIIIGILLIIIIIMQILSYIKINKQNLTETETNIFQKLESINSELDNDIENEFKRNREENLQSSKLVREEVGNSVRLLGDTLSNRIRDISERQKINWILLKTECKN